MAKGVGAMEAGADAGFDRLESEGTSAPVAYAPATSTPSLLVSTSTLVCDDQRPPTPKSPLAPPTGSVLCRAGDFVPYSYPALAVSVNDDDEAPEGLEYYKIVSGPMNGAFMWRMKTVRRHLHKTIMHPIPPDTHHPHALYRSHSGCSAA